MSPSTFQSGMINAEFQVQLPPATGGFWPANRDDQPQTFKGAMERLGDLDTRHNVGPGQDKPLTHSVHCAAIDGRPPVTNGMGVKLVRVKRAGSWQRVDPPITFAVGPVTQRPGSDTVRITLTEAQWSP